MPVFALLVSAVGGCLWLDAIPPGRRPGPEYGHLLESICHALELEGRDAAVTQFDFPLTDSPGLERNLSAARDALQGFLARQLERITPRAVLLLGDLEQPWFNRDCLAGYRVVSTVSVWRMLREPSLKPTAWSDLKALRVHDG
jgi:uracil-DNA glycosylase